MKSFQSIIVLKNNTNVYSFGISVFSTNIYFIWFKESFIFSNITFNEIQYGIDIIDITFDNSFSFYTTFAKKRFP